MGQKTKPAKPAKPAGPDRSLVEGGEDYEVRELAVSAGISVEQAEELVRKHGHNREKLVAKAKALHDAESQTKR